MAQAGPTTAPRYLRPREAHERKHQKNKKGHKTDGKPSQVTATAILPQNATFSSESIKLQFPLTTKIAVHHVQPPTTARKTATTTQVAVHHVQAPTTARKPATTTTKPATTNVQTTARKQATLAVTHMPFTTPRPPAQLAPAPTPNPAYIIPFSGGMVMPATVTMNIFWGTSWAT